MRPFVLERYFAKWEFAAPHILCASDCEPLHLKQLLEVADADSLERWSSLCLSYTEPQGLPALRAEITKLYKTVTSDDLVVCAPEEGIYLTMRALLKPGDHVVVQFPGYLSLYEVALSIGCRVTLWEPRLGEGGSIRFDIGDFRGLLEADTKLAVINFPHNPTGCQLSVAEYNELMEAVSDVGAYLFSDEMYRGLELPPTAKLPAGVDQYCRSISLCGMSKVWGLPGLRIGWLASHDQELLTRIMELKDYTSICNSATSEILALAALRASSPIVADNVAMLTSNRAQLKAFMQRWPDVFECQPPRAGSIAFPRLVTGEPIEQFTDRVVMSCGVLLLPGSVYEHPATTAKGHFRLGLGRRDFPAAIAVLEKFLQAGGATPPPEVKDPATAAATSSPSTPPVLPEEEAAKQLAHK